MSDPTDEVTWLREIDAAMTVGALDAFRAAVREEQWRE